VTLVGNSAVGKSCIFQRLIEGRFNNYSYNATIGIDFGRFKLKMEDKKYIKLQIWDTAGQERFRSLTSNYYRESNIVIIVYDVTNRESFDLVEYWKNEIKKH
jgi:Ras-related protein Rab-1A